MAVRQVENARIFLEPYGINVLQAPCLQPPQKSFPLSQNYGENLLKNGYWHNESLTIYLCLWLKLLEECDPDFVLCDHSPSVLLAARHLDIPRAAYGDGFFIPPRINPMPPLQPWLNLPLDYYVASEERFLKCVNPVMKAIGWDSLNCVADIFDGATTFLTTHAECDHYSRRRTDETYLGSVPYTPPECYPQWPAGDGQRVFVYLTGYSRHLDALFKTLKEHDCSVLAYLRDVDSDYIKGLETPKIRILRKFVNLRSLANNCDAAVTHGGAGTVINLLLAGVPTLLLPVELEHALKAYRLTERGLTYQINIFNPVPNLATRLKQLLETPPINLEDFSRRYQTHQSEQVLDTIVTRCEMLMN